MAMANYQTGIATVNRMTTSESQLQAIAEEPVLIASHTGTGAHGVTVV